MYDYYLGGKDNLAADREAAAKVIEAYPDNSTAILANRGFLVEAVRRCAEAGVDQFLDLGAGIPTSPNVHEVARETHPEARVVYVDNDPVVTAHNKALRAIDANIGVIEADLREPETIVDHPETRRLIDFDAPVAVLAVAVLHFVARHGPARLLEPFTSRMVPGSHLVVSAITTAGMSAGEAQRFREIYRSTASGSSGDQLDPDEFGGLFDGMELLEPGVAPAWQWCGDDGLATRIALLAAVGRVPRPHTLKEV